MKVWSVEVWFTRSIKIMNFAVNQEGRSDLRVEIGDKVTWYVSTMRRRVQWSILETPKPNYTQYYCILLFFKLNKCTLRIYLVK